MNHLRDPPAAPEIPPEVVDVIIDHLASNMRALRSCTTVARSWLPRSRHYLFQRLSISTSRLRRFLRRCADFGPGVVSLVFRASEGQWHQMTALLCEKAVSGTFISYNSLTSLGINGLHFPKFRHLVQLVSAFPRLQNISLSELTWNELDSTVDSAQILEHIGLFSCLQSLSFSILHLEPILDWLVRHDLPVLDRLSLTLYGSGTATRVLAVLAKRVPKVVQIGPPTHPSSKVLVRRMCELHGLSVQAEVILLDARNSFHELRLGLRPPPLRPFQIQQFTDNSIMCHVLTWRILDWGGIDDMLSSQKFAAFSRVALLIDDADSEDTRAQVCRQLPITACRGVLAFSNLRDHNSN